MGMVCDGRVVLTVGGISSTKVDVFRSVKEVVQHFITQTSIEGYWGSTEQLEALKETKLLLDRTIALVEEEIAEEHAHALTTDGDG
jgi:hypothetical protein